LPVPASFFAYRNAMDDVFAIHESGHALLAVASIRMFRPMAQPDSASACKNAPMRVWDTISSAENGMSTPTCRIRSGCCARADSGHAAHRLAT
jgi:hypothetical protein